MKTHTRSGLVAAAVAVCVCVLPAASSREGAHQLLSLSLSFSSFPNPSSPQTLKGTVFYCYRVCALIGDPFLHCPLSLPFGRVVPRTVLSLSLFRDPA